MPHDPANPDRSHFPIQKRALLAEKEVRAIELAARGYAQDAIGKEIGLTRSGVSKMLHRTEKKLVALLRDTGERIKARQTRYLEVIYAEAMGAWRRSQDDAESTKTVSGADGGAKTEHTVRGQAGDPRFLDQARGALQDIRKIWGLDEAATHVPPTAITIRVEFSDDFFRPRGVAAPTDDAIDGEVVRPAITAADESGEPDGDETSDASVALLPDDADTEGPHDG